ncbi:MAG TPA: hypothetical protein VF752_05265, partial [Thermoleophilaceae bacterium]
MTLVLILATVGMVFAFSGTAAAVPGPGAAPAPLCATPTSPTPGPCSTDWYTEDVKVTWEYDASGTPDPSTPDCLGRTQSTDTTAETFTCTVNWPASGDGEPPPPSPSSSASVTIKVDKTPPTVTEALARPPDYNGWYNHAVDFTFNGTDGAGSGVASCDPVTYSGPEGEGVHVTGTCTDVVGHVGTGSFPLNYDDTLPTLTNVTADDGDSEVTLTWVASTDTRTIDIVRSASGEPDKSIDDVASGAAAGGPGAYTDTTVSNGTHYTYTVIAHDRANN